MSNNETSCIKIVFLSNWILGPTDTRNLKVVIWDSHVFQLVIKWIYLFNFFFFCINFKLFSQMLNGLIYLAYLNKILLLFMLFSLTDFFILFFLVKISLTGLFFWVKISLTDLVCEWRHKIFLHLKAFVQCLSLTLAHSCDITLIPLPFCVTNPLPLHNFGIPNTALHAPSCPRSSFTPRSE